MQKDLRLDLENYVSKERLAVDSLSVRLNELARKLEQSDNIDPKEVERYNSELARNREIQNHYQDKINTRVNELDRTLINRLEATFPEFTKEMNVDVLLSRGGAYPAALYAVETIDITDEFILFINKDYSGEKVD